MSIKADLDHMQELTRRIQRSPRDPSIPCEIGKLFLRLGEPREGVAWLHRALGLDSQLKDAHGALADYYASAGDLDKADAERALAGGPPP